MWEVPDFVKGLAEFTSITDKWGDFGPCKRTSRAY